MARPTKLRRVEFIPKVHKFIPEGLSKLEVQENILRIEEIESIRLKDLEGLEQEDCAKKMEISRQTFQRILGNARKKIADSIISGKAIRIEGGNYTRNICNVRCNSCGKEWQESFEHFVKTIEGKGSCPKCKSNDLSCANKANKSFCRGNCWKHNEGKSELG